MSVVLFMILIFCEVTCGNISYLTLSSTTVNTSFVYLNFACRCEIAHFSFQLKANVKHGINSAHKIMTSHAFDVALKLSCKGSVNNEPELLSGIVIRTFSSSFVSYLASPNFDSVFSFCIHHSCQ
ncbi:hypothetical protein BYT27DRAFT_6413365 [Phlegmacium glaucopus]|nr:hypothetical protein BYT27DRAFT_6413365 [Phlegmacium glaucopus]